jgi:plasmid stabilization system protein ParE
MSRLVQRDEAAEDLIDAFVFLGEKNQSSARHFHRAAEYTFLGLAEQPEMGIMLGSENINLQGV